MINKSRIPKTATPLAPIITAALAGGGLGLFGSAAKSYLIDQPAATKAWERSQEATAQAYGRYKSRYQDTMDDMRAAGLNPILAASGGFNVGSAVEAARAPMANPTQYDSSSSAKIFGELRKMQSETEKNWEQIFVMGREARKIGAQIMNIGIDTVLKSEKAMEAYVNAEKLSQQIRTEVKRARQLSMQASRDEASAALLRKQQDLLKKQIEQMKYLMENLKQDAAVMGGPAGFWIKATERWMGAIGALIGGIPK